VLRVDWIRTSEVSIHRQRAQGGVGDSSFDPRVHGLGWRFRRTISAAEPSTGYQEPMSDHLTAIS
jgi:hypothetical protein